MNKFKKVYPMLKLLGYDLKFVLQDEVKTLAAHKNEYPFELIADGNCILYDRYNIFEAHDMIEMIAGDKMFEDMIGTDIKSMLDSDMVDDLAAVVAPSGETAEHRENQLCAMAAVDKNMKIIYHYYCKTISDFPDVKTMLKGLKG